MYPSLTPSLRRDCVACGTAPPMRAPWTFHDLRRSFATGIRNLGVDRLVLMKLLSHTDPSVTAVYDRAPLDSEQRTAVQAWADHVDVIVGDVGRCDAPL